MVNTRKKVLRHLGVAWTAFSLIGTVSVAASEPEQTSGGTTDQMASVDRALTSLAEPNVTSRRPDGMYLGELLAVDFAHRVSYSGEQQGTGSACISYHSDDILDEYGIEDIFLGWYAESVSDASLDSRVIDHTTLTGCQFLSGTGLFVFDAFRCDFSVPGTGMYAITITGTITGDFYDVGSSLLGASLGAGRLSLNARVFELADTDIAEAEELLYETDLSIGRFLEQASLAVIFSLIDGGNLIGALETLADLAEAEAEWDMHPFTITMLADLEAGETYSWSFAVESTTACAAAGVASQLTTFDVHVELDEVVIVADDCVCGEWINGACGGGSCSADERQRIRSCSPSECDVEEMCVADSFCGNSPPTLSNPRVVPRAGTESTLFEFLVHYYRCRWRSAP